MKATDKIAKISGVHKFTPVFKFRLHNFVARYILCIYVVQTMTTKISTWGNSLGLRLPKSIVTEMGLCPGTEVRFRETKGKLIIEPIEKIPPLKELLKNMKLKNRHPEYWSDIPQGKEVW